MQKNIDNMRGWLTGLLVLSLTVIPPFQAPQIALASDAVEEMQGNQSEFSLLNNSEWEAAALMEVSVEEEGIVAPAAEIPEEEVTVGETSGTKAPIIHQKKTSPLPKWRIEINYEQLDLLERCVMAEGGGESYECQVAIACVIINRVLSDKYPDTVEGVIKQKGQFSTWPKMIQKAVATNEVKQAVREALTREAIPEDVLYFRAGRYHKWATRYCRLDNTYFSTP